VRPSNAASTHAQQQHLGAGVAGGGQLVDCCAQRRLAQAEQFAGDLASGVVDLQARAELQRGQRRTPPRP
jgi:hypothetical protein